MSGYAHLDGTQWYTGRMDLTRRAELYARNATIDLRPSLPKDLTADQYLAIRAALATAFIAGIGVAVEPQLASDVASWMRPIR